jgi:hypothetical protein
MDGDLGDYISGHPGNLPSRVRHSLFGTP